MSIYTDIYLPDASKHRLAEYEARITAALHFKKDDGTDSKWVKFLQDHNILIAPGEVNVGAAFTEYIGKSVVVDSRTYDDLPGTFFKIGTVLNGTVIDKNIVYLNMNYDPKSFSSINLFAHELGHAIDYVLRTSTTNHYYSDEAAFAPIFDANKSFFDAQTDLHPNTKAYLHSKNEFFAECFAFYCTKKPMNQAECYDYFFNKARPVITVTPHDYLKTHALAMKNLFKSFA